MAMVNSTCIMNESKFDGPPPFSLDRLQLRDTSDRAQAMSGANVVAQVRMRFTRNLS